MLCSLNLSGKKVLFAGGGKIAERKVLSILKENALISIVSPEVTETIKKLGEEKRIKIISRKFLDDDINGMFLVFCATDDKEINGHIAKICSNKNILHDDISCHNNSDFMMVATVAAGELKIAISTDGLNPSISGKAKLLLENDLDYNSLTFEKYIKEIYNNSIKHYENNRK